MTSINIHILNGPNLGVLGTREPQIYGHETLAQIMANVGHRATELDASIEHFQSDVEGELVRYIHANVQRADGWIINPAAYTHTSVALRDAIASCAAPVVEVHLSNVHTREPFRQVNMTAPVCLGVIAGFGGFGYQLALDALVHHLRKPRKDMA